MDAFAQSSSRAMKIIYTISFIVVFCSQIYAGNLTNEDLKQLIYAAPTDIDSENDNAWISQIRSFPDLTPKIYVLLNQEKNPEALNPIFSALRVRGDLDSKSLEELLNKAIEIADSENEPQAHDQVFASGVFSLLEDFPSDVHEKILIKYFNVHDGAYRHSIINALEHIGTSACLPVLNDLFDFRTQNNPSDFQGMLIKRIIAKIEMRENRKNRQKPEIKSKPKPTSDQAPSLSSETEKRDPSRGLKKGTFLVLGIATIFLIYWISKKRRT
jgi:hypothetical protein